MGVDAFNPCSMRAYHQLQGSRGAAGGCALLPRCELVSSLLVHHRVRAMHATGRTTNRASTRARKAAWKDARERLDLTCRDADTVISEATHIAALHRLPTHRCDVQDLTQPQAAVLKQACAGRRISACCNRCASTKLRMTRTLEEQLRIAAQRVTDQEEEPDAHGRAVRPGNPAPAALLAFQLTVGSAGAAISCPAAPHTPAGSSLARPVRVQQNEREHSRGGKISAASHLCQGLPPGSDAVLLNQQQQRLLCAQSAA